MAAVSASPAIADQMTRLKNKFIGNEVHHLSETGKSAFDEGRRGEIEVGEGMAGRGQRR